MKRILHITSVVLLLFTAVDAQIPDQPGIIVLCIAQDGGFPHAACVKECCTAAWADFSIQRSAGRAAGQDMFYSLKPYQSPAQG